MSSDMNEKKIGGDLSKVNCLIKFSSKHAIGGIEPSMDHYTVLVT